MSCYIFAPSLLATGGAQDGGANKASGIIDERLLRYRQLFVDVGQPLAIRNKPRRVAGPLNLPTALREFQFLRVDRVRPPPGVQ